MLNKYKVQIRESESNALIITLGIFESEEVADKVTDLYFSDNFSDGDSEGLEAQVVTIQGD